MPTTGLWRLEVGRDPLKGVPPYAPTRPAALASRYPGHAAPGREDKPRKGPWGRSTRPTGPDAAAGDPDATLPSTGLDALVGELSALAGVASATTDVRDQAATSPPMM